MGTPPVRQVRCPTCSELCLFTAANRWRPFCSARCGGIDLGAWAAENYRVAAKPSSAETADEPGAEPQH